MGPFLKNASGKANHLVVEVAISRHLHRLLLRWLVVSKGITAIPTLCPARASRQSMTKLTSCHHKALVRATEQSHPRRERNQQMLDSVIGLVFLGTPFVSSWETGRKAAEMRLKAARLAAAEEGIQYSTELVSYLAPTTPDVPSPLDELVQRFREMVAHSEFKIPIVCFYETRHTNFSAYKSRLPKSDGPTEFDGPGSGIVR